MIQKLFTVFALGSALFACGAVPAGAQGYPQRYGPGDGYDRTFAGRYHVQGFVTSFGGYNLTLRIHGGAQPVNLHQGTVLRPLGLTLAPGMLVRCDGYFNGSGLFIAEQITLLR